MYLQNTQTASRAALESVQRISRKKTAKKMNQILKNAILQKFRHDKAIFGQKNQEVMCNFLPFLWKKRTFL